MARGNSLLAYAITRAALAVPMLLILLTAVFFVLRILPGDPVLALWGSRNPPPEVLERARQALGLDKPIWVQYTTYLSGVFRGDFGTSIGEVYLGWLPPPGRWRRSDFPHHVTGMYTVDSLLEGNLAHFQTAVEHLILPCLTLGLVLSGFFTSTVRANMLRTMSADYTEAARS